MNRQQIDLLLENPNYESPLIIETHISWLFFTRLFVYKMKKNVKYSFLDFSTLEKRKYYCKRELELNQRLAPDLYLNVVPVRQNAEHVAVDAVDGAIIGYAVKMKRMDNSREMDRMLVRDEVTQKHMEQLAKQLSTFHANANSIKTPFNFQQTLEDFSDILQHRAQLVQMLGLEAINIIEESTEIVRKFLLQYSNRLLIRRTAGFTVDGHGDLHTGNIFLAEKPIIFDCIEFNDRLRHLDVLDEVAFLCLDLEAFQKPDLATHFLHHYLLHYPCMPKPEDQLIFIYYKLYRANVKLKVTAIKLLQMKDKNQTQILENKLNSYYHLFEKYLSILKSEYA